MRQDLPYTAQTEIIGTKTAALSIECMGMTLTLPVDVTVKGNKPEYSVAQTPALADSPAAGRGAAPVPPSREMEDITS